MKRSYIGSLPRSSPATMMRPRSGSIVLALLWAVSATAQEKAEPKREELDVTMQIITDPNAKLPEEVVRRIPLPAPKAAPAATPADTKRTADPAAKGQERAREAKEQGKDMVERGKERAREATEQREQAERSRAEEKRRNPPKDPPGRPNEPRGR